MSKTNVLIYTNVGKSQIEETDTHFKISGIPVTKNNTVMNRVAYFEKDNAEGMPTIEEQPITLRHPEVDGVNVSAKQGKGLMYFSGSLVGNSYLDKGVWKVDALINKKKLAAQDDGERWTEILSNKETFGVSTGLTFTRNSQKGDIDGEEYDMVAMGQNYDHLAFLDPKVESPAGGDNTMVRFNANVEQGEIIVCNIDEQKDKTCKDKRSAITKAWNAAKKLAGINALSHDDIRRQLNDEINNDQQRDRYKWVVEVYDSYFIYIDDSEDGNYYQMSYEIDSDDSVGLSGEPQKVVKKFIKANSFAPAQDKGYNSQEFDNQQNEDSIMNRDEMLEALGLATNSQVTDDELKTLMKSKLAANASEGFTKEDVESIVNAAIKPLADQLTANANKELDALVSQVVGLKINGIDEEVAKTMGVNALKGLLAANGQEFVADGYQSAHNGRSAATNKKDDEFDSIDLNKGLEE